MSVAKAGSANRASKWRGADDFYPTPAGATWALVNLGILPHRVWEPACGDGAMSRVLAAGGHDVVSSTLVDRGYGETGVDFLQQTELRAPAIVTNPPFNLADDFIRHALDLQPEIVCMFLRLKCLEGRRRHDSIYTRACLAEVHTFIERVKFHAGDIAADQQPGWNTEAFAWFVWRPAHRGPFLGGWVSRDAGPDVEMFG